MACLSQPATLSPPLCLSLLSVLFSSAELNVLVMKRKITMGEKLQEKEKSHSTYIYIHTLHT